MPLSAMNPPIIVGATGGSGTRVVARILHGAGVYIGRARNESEDAMEFVEFYDRWINRFVRRHGTPLEDAEVAGMNREFDACFARHRSGISSEQTDWGWKEPRSLYLVPFFDERCPGMKFLHVVRDGRDMAFSQNQNQLRKHGAAVLGDRYDSLPAPVRSAALWSQVNGVGADYGETIMGPRYLRLRFEDVCQDPVSSMRRICAFIGRQPPVDAGIRDVAPPESIGRWRTVADEDLIRAVTEHAQPSLNRFGYST
jgi:hypothetical protein